MRRARTITIYLSHLSERENQFEIYGTIQTWFQSFSKNGALNFHSYKTTNEWMAENIRRRRYSFRYSFQFTFNFVLKSYFGVMLMVLCSFRICVRTRSSANLNCVFVKRHRSGTSLCICWINNPVSYYEKSVRQRKQNTWPSVYSIGSNFTSPATLVRARRFKDMRQITRRIFAITWRVFTNGTVTV